MNIVWAVTSGAYSDYRVHAIYATKPEAEAAAALANRLLNRRYWYEVEELPFGATPRLALGRPDYMTDIWFDAPPEGT